MDSNDIFDFSSTLPDVENWTVAGGQYAIIGVHTLSDILNVPLNQLFQTAIMEHYRTCRLNYAACNQLMELLGRKGINVVFDKSIEPDITLVPAFFASVDAKNETIITIFDRLVMELGRTPSIDELTYETGLSKDNLCNNREIRKLILERQQVQNYIEWFCRTHSCEIHSACPDCNELRKINWSTYPFNLLLDVVPAIERIKATLEEKPEFLSKLIQRLETLVYFDLPIEEKNAVAVLYIEGAMYFREPALQWGLECWGRTKKYGTIRHMRRLFQGGKLLVEKGLLGNDAILDFTIEELGLSERAYNRFKYSYTYIDTVAALVSKSKKELSKLRQHSLDEVVNKVHHLGLCFSDEEPK